MEVGSREATFKIPENFVENVALVFTESKSFVEKSRGSEGRKGYKC